MAENMVLVIEYQGEKYVYPLPFWSTNKTQEGRDEENLLFGAVQMYDNIYMHPVGICHQTPGMGSAQFALPFLAEHYGLKRDLILSTWMKEYGSYRAWGILPDNSAKKQA